MSFAIICIFVSVKLLIIIYRSVLPSKHGSPSTSMLSEDTIIQRPANTSHVRLNTTHTANRVHFQLPSMRVFERSRMYRNVCWEFSVFRRMDDLPLFRTNLLTRRQLRRCRRLCTLKPQELQFLSFGNMNLPPTKCNFVLGYSTNEWLFRKLRRKVWVN